LDTRYRTKQKNTTQKNKKMKNKTQTPPKTEGESRYSRRVKRFPFLKRHSAYYSYLSPVKVLTVIEDKIYVEGKRSIANGL
jgi:hypothetical protein